MEQYSDLNVKGKITQKATQGTNPDDIVKYPTLTGRVPATLPTPSAGTAGQAVIINANGDGYTTGEAGKVDDVQINGTTIVLSKIANIPKAASNTLGVVRIGTNISIDSDGIISTPSVSATDSGSGNLVTGVSASGHALTVTKGIGYTTTADPSKIVQRKSDGQITVPSTPSADTDAASKAFVNSSVGTNTATFRGTYNAVSDLSNSQAQVDMWEDPPSYMGITGYSEFTSVDQYVGYYVNTTNTPHVLVTSANKSTLGIVPGTTKAYNNTAVESTVAGQIATKLSSLTPSVTPENNDYVFVSVDQTPVGDLGEDWYWRFKYSDPNNDHTGSWGYEYTLNNSSFTQAQWDAVNSGITADKVNKLDGIEAGAEVNVQADWNQTTDTADDYIKNKPTIGSANFKVQGQGTDASTFSANATSAVTLNIKQGGATTVTAGTNEITISSTDQSVTASSNHYTPSTASGQDKTASASGATAAWSIDVVKGVTLNTDGKGHVTGLSVTSGKIPAQPTVPDITVATSGDGNAVTAIEVDSTDKHKLNVTKGTTFLTSHQTIKQDGITGATINRYGVCDTAATTSAKTVSITSGTFPTLDANANGTRISVKFTYANTTPSPTLNVNSKGAKNIYYQGSRIGTGIPKTLLRGICDFIYDNDSGWHLVGNNNDSVYQSLLSSDAYRIYLRAWPYYAY